MQKNMFTFFILSFMYHSKFVQTFVKSNEFVETYVKEQEVNKHWELFFICIESLWFQRCNRCMHIYEHEYLI